MKIRCVICGRAALGPVSLTENYHELYCPRCAGRWGESVEKKLVEQLVVLGEAAGALSQYQHFQARLGRELGVVA